MNADEYLALHGDVLQEACMSAVRAAAQNCTDNDPLAAMATHLAAVTANEAMNPLDNDEEVTSYLKLHQTTIESAFSDAVTAVINECSERPLAALASHLESLAKDRQEASAQANVHARANAELVAVRRQGRAPRPPPRRLEAQNSMIFTDEQIADMAFLSSEAEPATSDAQLARATQRRAFLVTVEELVGPPPPARSWRDEFSEAAVQSAELSGEVEGAATCRAASSEENIRRHLESNEGVLLEEIEEMVKGGWERDAAEAVRLLAVFAVPAIRRALCEGRKELAASCHAYAGAVGARAAQATQVPPPLYYPLRGMRRGGSEGIYPGLVEIEPSFATIETPDATNFRGVTSFAPLSLFDDPSRLKLDGCYRFDYAHRYDQRLDGPVVRILSRPNGASAMHAAALVSTHPVPLYCFPPNTLYRLVSVEEPPCTVAFRRWGVYTNAEGRRVFVDRRGEQKTKVSGRGHRGPKVAQVSEEELQLQTRELEDIEDVEWEETEDGQFVKLRTVPHPRAPKGFVQERSRKAADMKVDLAGVGYDPEATFEKVIQQRVLTCTATYVLSSAAAASAVAAGGVDARADLAAEVASLDAKLCEGVTTLSYLDRQSYARGTDDLTRGLSHALAHEWMRESCRWSDWKCVAYTGAAEWGYVNGVAAVKEATPGLRDVPNAGLPLDGFVERANAHIRARLGARTATPVDLLSVDEVRAVRLYTGPAFQPINGWLRRVATLDVGARRAAALDGESSFGATVGCLIAAIRKLAAVNTTEDNARKLYRGLKGVLPASFWLPDAAGLVCACDSAFMSTSMSEATPVHYMAAAPQPNVLWELEAAAEDDVGYHCGASVEMLSQFPGEREVLFPPYTLLVVQLRGASGAATDINLPTAGGAASSVLGRVERSRAAHRVTNEEAGDAGTPKLFERVGAMPSFVG